MTPRPAEGARELLDWGLSIWAACGGLRAELAEAVGTSPATVSRWATGEALPARWQMQPLLEAITGRAVRLLYFMSHAASMGGGSRQVEEFQAALRRAILPAVEQLHAAAVARTTEEAELAAALLAEVRAGTITERQAAAMRRELEGLDARAAWDLSPPAGASGATDQAAPRLFDQPASKAPAPARPARPEAGADPLTPDDLAALLALADPMTFPGSGWRYGPSRTATAGEREEIERLRATIAREFKIPPSRMQERLGLRSIRGRDIPRLAAAVEQLRAAASKGGK